MNFKNESIEEGNFGLPSFGIQLKTSSNPVISQTTPPSIFAPLKYSTLQESHYSNNFYLSNSPTKFNNPKILSSNLPLPALNLINNIPSNPFHSQSLINENSPNFEVYSSSLKLNKDEIFVLKPVEKLNEISPEPVRMKITPMHNKLKIGKTEVDLVCTLSLLGLSRNLEIIEKNREGLDLVFVVDISGSMGSGKIDLVKVTIEFVLTILKDYDRVSIIGFSDNAFIYCPLTVMNEVGKLKVGNIVKSLGPTGGTHIESGVRAALHLLADRRMVNQLTAIMLLSDGVDNDTETVNNRVREAIDEFRPKIIGSFKLHTFGYGADHDSAVMNLMAELTRGNFYYIENFTSVNEAFSNCMGELVSLVASKIRVSLIALPCELPFKLSRVFSSNGDTSFDMPDLLFDDKQDAVFILKFYPIKASISGKITPIKALVSYTLKGGSQVRKEICLKIKLAGENEEILINQDVQVEYYRVRGAEALKSITIKADGGQMEEARMIGNKFQVELEGSSVNSTPPMQHLLKDIVDAQVRTENVDSWNSGGRAQTISISINHSNKISSNNCVSYQKPIQAMYSNNAAHYSQTLPVRIIDKPIQPQVDVDYRSLQLNVHQPLLSSIPISPQPHLGLPFMNGPQQLKPTPISPPPQKFYSSTQEIKLNNPPLLPVPNFLTITPKLNPTETNNLVHSRSFKKIHSPPLLKKP